MGKEVVSIQQRPDTKVVGHAHAEQWPKLPARQCDVSQPELRRRRRSRGDTQLTQASKSNASQPLPTLARGTAAAEQGCSKPSGASGVSSLVGELVRVQGLVHAAQFNGRWGRVESRCINAQICCSDLFGEGRDSRKTATRKF